MSNKISFSYGPAAANIYCYDSNQKLLYQLQYDYCYSSIDFFFNNKWQSLKLNQDDYLKNDIIHIPEFITSLKEMIKKVESFNYYNMKEEIPKLKSLINKLN
jgi:hypothetical protein